LSGILANILSQFELQNEDMTIEVFPHIPRAMGLGGSSALAVAILRALDHSYQLGLNHERINELAYECEKAAHGTPSGVDNTVATYGTALRFTKTDDGPLFETVKLGQPLQLVVGITGKESLTADTVARVRQAWQQHPQRYEGIFDQIGQLTDAATRAVTSGQINELGELMNLCHGYLNALQLSTPELEELVHIARAHGAVGAKLTGGGGGGSMVALCPDSQQAVQRAMQAAGYDTLEVTLS
jgi:hydroxymethylglutaryl-CoA reductase